MMNQVHRWIEFEDWVEFYTAKELACVGKGKYEVMMNFGGPGSATPYHFFARVIEGGEKVITNVAVEEEIFQPANKIVSITRTPQGFRWVYLGYVKMQRNYHRVTITAPGGLAKLDRLCVLEVMQRLESGEIERRIARDGMAPEPLSGVPLGGVGAGKIELCRDGLFRNITINGNIDTPIWRTQGAFFAVRSEVESRSLGRIVSTESLHGLVPMEKIEFNGLYPKAFLKGMDRVFPLRVEIRASGTIIPQNIKDSALPLAVFRVRLIACGEKPVKATVAFCMENFIGRGGSIASLKKRNEGFYELWEEYVGNCEQPWKKSGAEGLLFGSNDKEEKRSQGQYILGVSGHVSSRLMGWHFHEHSDVWDRFVDTGKLPDISARPSKGEQTAGAICVEVNMQPGEIKDIRFIFAWYVPHFWQSADYDYGHYYCNEFRSVEEVALYGLSNFERLETESDAIPNLLLNSTLPKWLSRSLCNDAYVFSTATWLTKDGRFAVNESPTHMFGCMGTLDQKLYANHYYTLFFPELDRTELLCFARTQGKNGGIQHDFGYGHLEQNGKGHGWPDLSSALVILSLKHYQITGDQSYIDEVYPCLVRALLDFQLGMDTDGDGIANISGVGNTFDAELFEGTSAYIVSLWLVALKALENLARRRNDTKVIKQCQKCFEKARANAIEQLWNGQFFVNYYDSVRKHKCPNSHFSQIAGEFFSQFCGLGSLYGDQYVRQALVSMLHLNYHPSLAFPTNEATPKGKMPCRKIWGWLPHARIYLGGTPMYFGLAEEGMHVLERMEKVVADVHNGDRWDQRLFYEPDTGKPHWGRFYMSAPATWYVYQALLGYRWDHLAGTLSIIPNLPDSMLPFEGPLFLPKFWAWLTLSKDRSIIVLKIIKKFNDTVVIKKLCLFEHPGTMVVTADGKLISTKRVISRLEGEEEYYSCYIDIDKIRQLKIEFA